MTTTEELANVLDSWVEPNGPVALHLKQKLLPVEGEGAVIFPPTYAEIGYNIDTLSDGSKVATIDSVGSQANRMELIFKLPDYAALVPQIEIEYSDHRRVSIFDVGHRLGDALIRSTSLKDEAQAAFKALLDTGNAQPIAKLAPTSLVFGVWDSRDTQAKLPRLVQSVIRAWNVETLTRSATYNPPLNYAALDVFSEEDKAKAEGDPKNPLSKRGFVNALNTSAPGGIISNRIEQDVTINLIALRRLQAVVYDKAKEEGTFTIDEKESETATHNLRRYLLGLSLVAATAPLDGFLRQGCLLTPAPKEEGEKIAKWQVVNRDGTREDVELTDAMAKSYAEKVAKKFVVGSSKSGEQAAKFDKDLARADVMTSKAADERKSGKGKGGKGKGGKAKGAETGPTDEPAAEE